MELSARRYLTKSGFQRGLECARKLYYLAHPERYTNARTADPFLAALAEGGFQVGALARSYRPEGILVDQRDNEGALATTATLLQRENVTIFEAALSYGRLLVRVDVLVKTGSRIRLNEAKSKGIGRDDSFYTKRDPRHIASGWESYIADVAFQTFVVRGAMPHCTVTPVLLLVDKDAEASVDGINQRFLIARERGRPTVIVRSGTTPESLGRPLLREVDVSEAVDVYLATAFERPASFEGTVRALEAYATRDERAAPTLGTQCKACEFRVPTSDLAPGDVSGFAECWGEAARMTSTECDEPMVFDVWNYRKTATAMEHHTYLARELSMQDVAPKPDPSKPGLSSSERQWEQVRKLRDRESTPYIDRAGMRVAMAGWRYPHHHIDFETSMVALPFQKGRRPYEQLAFQFSHHVVTADGTVAHVDQYLHRTRGEFPNFAFVRALRRSLGGDGGTVFHYSHHERTVLRKIMPQLESSTEPDRESLIRWIESITGDGGPMFDLCEFVKRYYYHPRTGGSNSIKDVLPAVLAESTFLREKYGRPIYGAKDGIASLNYADWQWLRTDARGDVRDPYDLLPPIVDDDDRNTLDRMFVQEDIADGGAAMTAFARMQFTEMSPREHEQMCAALLKYCELDTLAMVMLVEAWQAEVRG